MDLPYSFRIVADYIHLNPARSRLAGGGEGKLISYTRSSLPDYARGQGPSWLVMDRVLNAFELSKDGRGRKAYVDWLEERAKSAKGEVSEEAMKVLRRGWYLGEPTFADKLRALVKPDFRREVGSDAVGRAHDEIEAEHLRILALEALDLPTDPNELTKLKKGDVNKVLVAVLLKNRTSVGNRWLSERLAMGHVAAMSRHVTAFKQDADKVRRLGELEEMLNRNT